MILSHQFYSQLHILIVNRLNHSSAAYMLGDIEPSPEAFIISLLRDVFLKETISLQAVISCQQLLSQVWDFMSPSSIHVVFPSGLPVRFMHNITTAVCEFMCVWPCHIQKIISLHSVNTIPCIFLSSFMIILILEWKAVPHISEYSVVSYCLDIVLLRVYYLTSCSKETLQSRIERCLHLSISQITYYTSSSKYIYIYTCKYMCM